MLAAVDKRVVATAPIVLSILNLKEVKIIFFSWKS